MRSPPDDQTRHTRPRAAGLRLRSQRGRLSRGGFENGSAARGRRFGRNSPIQWQSGAVAVREKRRGFSHGVGRRNRQRHRAEHRHQRHAQIMLGTLQTAPCRVRRRPMHGARTMVAVLRARAYDVRRRKTCGEHCDGCPCHDQYVQRHPGERQRDKQTSELRHVPTSLVRAQASVKASTSVINTSLLFVSMLERQRLRFSRSRTRRTGCRRLQTIG